MTEDERTALTAKIQSKLDTAKMREFNAIAGERKANPHVQAQIYSQQATQPAYERPDSRNESDHKISKMVLFFSIFFSGVISMVFVDTYFPHYRPWIIDFIVFLYGFMIVCFLMTRLSPTDRE